ncbi:hypothetical protein [Alienimonas californiensis]|uniref:DUF1570 domain-containing protein n=1 Tax=Alienimonas californiensis TaxID=2527989 RepID=A0A517PDX4_9PLAN|nr:hypothetical protein [Alienimonas californiensis]QDT17585.1 hypothetical protein CA12_37130 [Alienimonas californiensis]
MPSARSVLLPAALLLIVAAPAPGGGVADVGAAVEPLREAYRAELTTFAGRADAAGLAEFAAELRLQAAPPDPQTLSVTPPPRTVRPELPPVDRSEETALRRAVRRAGQGFGQEAFLLAKRAGTRGAEEPGAANLAMGLVWEILAADPDHVEARRALGQKRVGDEWLTPWEQGQARVGRVDHKTFGWTPKLHVERLEAGERLLDGRWVDADREALVRSDFATGWEVETEHYQVRTNVSLERGAEIARQLERFHAFFRATFPGFGLGPEDLRQRFVSVGRFPSYQNIGGAGGKYHVHLYRERAEYNLALIKQVPQIEMTNGFYDHRSRIASFYENGPNADPRTLFHEATHQLFYECTPQFRLVGEDAHYWAVEGIGCYMESFRDDGVTMTAGSPRYVRFVNARARWIDQQFFVPLAEFDARGRVAFQTAPDIHKCYSQASGLTHFFLHAGGGALRPALTLHLEDLYNPTVRPEQVRSLDRLTGLTWEALGEHYKQYLVQ